MGRVEEEGSVSSLTRQMAAMECHEDNLQLLADQLTAHDTDVQAQALVYLVDALSKEPENIAAVHQMGLVPEFVRLLRSENRSLQLGAAKALVLVTSSTERHTRTVVDSGVIPHLIQLLRSSDAQLAQQALWSLGNIAGDNVFHREVLNKHGTIRAILGCMERRDLSRDQIKTAVWALSNVCRQKTAIELDVVVDCIPVLRALLLDDDPELLQDVCFTCSYLSEGPGSRVQSFIDSRMCERLVPLLWHKEPTVVYPVLRTISNMVSGTDDQTQAVVDCGVVRLLVGILKFHPGKRIVKEACWALSNITAGPWQQLQVVIDEDGFGELVRIARRGPPDLKTEAIWAIGNALMGAGPDQIREIANMEVVRVMCDMLMSVDVTFLTLAVESLWSILISRQMDEGNGFECEQYSQQDEDEEFWEYARWISGARGLQRLARLRMHPDDAISTKSMEILSMLIDTPLADYSDLDDEDSTSEDDENDGVEEDYYVEPFGKDKVDLSGMLSQGEGGLKSAR
ncbi:hypothetical protein BSKO_00327 [Bryopsis sp. KO-2023]|nr:hypothetical protein BSKO_00327 [Bryopsis sp. KO-2023]